MGDKKSIVNNPILKGNSYFIAADSKTQQGDEVSNDNQDELFQQTPQIHIDCNTPNNLIRKSSNQKLYQYWENESRTLSFSFLIDQSQHTTQHTIIKSNNESSKCLDDQGIKEKIYL